MREVLWRGWRRKQQSVTGAFLAYLLSYFIFLSLLENGLHSYVFPIAVLFVKGKRLALASLFLGSLYVRLDEFLKNSVKSVGQYDVDLRWRIILVVISLERFGAVSPILVEFKLGKP